MEKSLAEQAADVEREWGVKAVVEDDGVYCPVEGREYVNDNYGFRISIPPEFTGLTAVPPLPNHGCFVLLSKSPRSVIVVEAHYNAAMHESLAEAVAAEMGHKEQMIEHKTRLLRGIPAIQLHCRYPAEETGGERITVELKALDRKEDDMGILYSLTLYTEVSRYDTDREVFESFVNSWRRLEIDPRQGPFEWEAKKRCFLRMGYITSF